ncbi:putative RNA-directed DNA polymerase, eukaryota, reverse transcriptase zinc-binding domain protein [Tanacetum coccineum]
MPIGSNSSFITLILKVSNPIHVKDYRPISLINIHYKLIAKFLANRLAKVVDKIVSQDQYGFISGRQILNGPLMLSEMIDWFKKKMLIFEVDFEKAFDFVSWKYLDFMRHNLGFGPTWRSWIKACLESSRTSIVVNRNPTFEFSVKRGLRQGDPLSPFLFIIVIEGLHTDLMEASHSGLIRVFYLASGLKINIYKSNVYGVGVSDIKVHTMTNNTGCSQGSFPFIYLGLPIGASMNLTVNWKILLDRFDVRLSKWKANLFSIGGRLTLIKSKKAHLFLWGGPHDSRKLAWVKWPIVLASGVNGGLGIGSLKAFNLALLQKWRWRMISNTNALWVKIMGSSNYLHSNAILPSDFIRFHVGGGTSIRFWKVLWTGISPLYLRYNRLFRLEQDKDCLISDRFKDNQWTRNWSRSFMGACNSAYITDIKNKVSLTELSSERDVCYWTIADDGMFSVSSTRHHIDSLILLTLDNPTQ